jgi:asparagine synthase (glutamine-hydrolysing)
MCGIAGVCHLRDEELVDGEILRSMIQAVFHRGPDDVGFYRDRGIGMAGARLSIIDLEGGRQPIGNEDGTIWIVFNGEIFNYVELRPALEAKGHRFATNSDTEVILHLYEEQGSAALRQLNGQFAIAIWDGRKRQLLLARDRLGIRPLHYTEHQGRLLFASEVKSFLAYPGLDLEIDPDALRQVFTFWSVLTPGTVFRGVRQVPPGHALIAGEGGISVEPYWQPEFQEPTARRTESDYLEELEALLTDATRIRLRADVPVGAYLSGGMDSSVIASLIRNRSDTPLDTFSISFSDPRYDESGFQRRMVSSLGTRHHELLCTDEEIGRCFPEVIWHTEAPILRTAPAPMYLLSEQVHRHGYKVVLTGEGADEVLAGYDIFKEMRVRRFWARQPESEARPLLLRRLYPDIPRTPQGEAFWFEFFRQGLDRTGSPFYSHEVRWANTHRATRFLAAGDGRGIGEAALQGIPLPSGFSGWSPLAQAQYLEMVSFLSTYLLSSQGDRVAMAHSVEGRYPFLDYRVVEFCNRLPSDVKQRGLTEKWLLRRLAARLIPSEIWQRTKRPYRAPIQRTFFRGVSGMEYVSDLLSPGALRQSGYFKPEAVGKLMVKAKGEGQLSEVDEMALVGILSTQLVDHWLVRRARRPEAAAPWTNPKVVDAVRIGDRAGIAR